MMTQYICHCSAYTFPHAYGRGKCKPLLIVEKAWNERSCPKDCSFLRGDLGTGLESCTVLSGNEKFLIQCPVLFSQLKEKK